MQEGQFDFERVLRVVCDGGQAITKFVLKLLVKFREGFFIDRDWPKRSSVPFVGRGQKRLGIGVVHG